MRVQHVKKPVAILLVLAMLIGMFTVLSFGGAVSAATTGLTPDEVDEFKIVSPNYQSNWAGSTIHSESYGKWVRADGAYSGSMQWGAGYTAATLDADGVLSFPASANPSLKFMPNQNYSVKAGPVRLTFDICIDEDTPKITYEGNRNWLFHIENGKLYYTSNKWWNADANKVLISELTEGWNIIEMVLLPIAEGGTVSTDSADTLEDHIMYIRAYPSESADTVTGYTPAQLNDLFYKTTLVKNKGEAEDMVHFISGISGSATFKIADKDSADGKTDVFKIRAASAANLEPYVDNPVVSFLGYSDLTQTVEAGTTITIPEAEGIDTWLLDGKYYVPGDTYTVSKNVSFMPVTSSFWNLTEFYNAESAWASGSSIYENNWGDFHAAEAWTPVTLWQGTKANGDYSYNHSEKTITLYAGGTNSGYVQWYSARKVGGSTIDTSAENLVYSFEVMYDPADFDGIKIGIGSNVAINSSGKFNVGSTEVGTLKEGWNTIRMYMVASYTNSALDGYNVYYSLNDETADGAMMSTTALEGFTSAKWNRTSSMSAAGNTFKIEVDATGSTTENRNSMTLRHFKSYTMAATAVHTIAVENTRDIYLVPTGGNFTVPTVTGIDKWIATDTATGVVNIVDSETVIPVTTDYTVIGAVQDASKFGRASISLGAEMTLNMKVNPEALTTGTVESMQAIANVSNLGGVADAAFDAYGYYNIPIKGIRAKDMWEDLDLYLLTKIDGVYYISTDVQVYSPLTYIERMYGKSSSDVQSLLAAMANYAAVAEKQAYNSEHVLTAMTELGIASAVPTLPADAAAYTNAGVTEDDKSTINSYVATGATLTENLNLVFKVNEGVTLSGVRITIDEWSEEYTVNADGKIIVDGLSAASIRTLFTITFLDADGQELDSANLAIGNFLEIRRADATEKDLAEATVIYMMAVRSYALAN